MRRLHGISGLRPVGVTSREVGGSSTDIIASGNMSFPGLDVVGSVQARIRPCPPTDAGTWLVFAAGANVIALGEFVFGVGPLRDSAWLVTSASASASEVGGFVFGVTPERDSSWIVAPEMEEVV